MLFRSDAAADGRADAHVTLAAGLADADVGVVDVADLADGGAAVDADLAHLAAGHTDGGHAAFLGHQLSGHAGGADQLGALAGVQLDACLLYTSKIVLDLIRGKDVATAVAILMQTPKAASEPCLLYTSDLLFHSHNLLVMMGAPGNNAGTAAAEQRAALGDIPIIMRTDPVSYTHLVRVPISELKSWLEKKLAY